MKTGIVLKNFCMKHEKKRKTHSNLKNNDMVPAFFSAEFRNVGIHLY
jgi:hypothetical protein